MLLSLFYDKWFGSYVSKKLNTPWSIYRVFTVDFFSLCFENFQNNKKFNALLYGKVNFAKNNFHLRSG